MDSRKEIENTIERIALARTIAAEVRENEKLHRLTMQTIFVLEDLLFVLHQMADRGSGGKVSFPGADAP